VFEYLEGKSLQSYVEEKGKLELEEALELT